MPRLILELLVDLGVFAAIWFFIAWPLGNRLARRASVEGFRHSGVGYWGPMALLHPVRQFIEDRTTDWIILGVMTVLICLAIAALERTRWWRPLETSETGIRLRLFPLCPTTTWSWSEVETLHPDHGGLVLTLATPSGQRRVARTAKVNSPQWWVDWFTQHRSVDKVSVG